MSDSDIEKVIAEVVKQCKTSGGGDVSPTLAAFIARTVIYENSDTFQMDQDMTETDIEDLVDMCVQKLCVSDSPGLETVKIQVAFDLSYMDHTKTVEDTRLILNKKLENLIAIIVEVRAKSSSDFESLTVLYRQIFSYLMVHAQRGKDGATNNAVELEVAAALESVFPRIGLKAFIGMSQREKESQLQELANIVLGIRLFNKEIGKGGADLVDESNLSKSDAANFVDGIRREITETATLCQQYTDVLQFLHESNGGEDMDATADQVKRFQDELTNRRQYVYNLQSLQEDAMMAQDKIGTANGDYLREMADLKAIVGARTSVPKEQVYPKFDILASLYLNIADERKMLQARIRTWRDLQACKDTFDPTLTDEWISAARDWSMAKKGRPTFEEKYDEGNDGSVAADARFTGGSGGASPGGAETGGRPASPKAAAAAGGPDAFEGNDDVPIRLSIESTPEFMQLPLEYQGYCSHTVVHRDALLLPGNPALGVVRYKGSFYVFTSEDGVSAFIADPVRYTSGVVECGRRYPELIHLLRLQEFFPKASLNQLLSKKAATDGVHPLLSDGPAVMVDQSTGTPVHFIERNIDPNYSWNEWELRRRALQVANLKKCKTKSAQTDMSAYRRETETQVYRPKTKTTQTRVERGTNPKRVHTYLAGLRNGPGAGGASQFAVDENGNRTKKKTSVVNLTFEL